MATLNEQILARLDALIVTGKQASSSYTLSNLAYGSDTSLFI